MTDRLPVHTKMAHFTVLFENDPLSFIVNAKRTETFENASHSLACVQTIVCTQGTHSLVGRLLSTIAVKVAIGAFMTDINKRALF